MKALLHDLVLVSKAVGTTSARLEKRTRIAVYLQGLDPGDVRLAASYLSGEVPQGALNVGWRGLQKLERQPAEALPLFGALEEPGLQALTLFDVDGHFRRLKEIAGAGAARRRKDLLRELLSRAAKDEAAFLRNLILGELRQGALRALVLEATGEAFEVDPDVLRRSVMFADFGEVVESAARGGAAAMERFGLCPLRPVEPMLAATAEDLEGALADLGGAVAEWKLDGVRIQVHRDDSTVRVFTRQLRDVTANLTELVELAQGLSAPSFVLDGEIIALDENGRPLEFQDLMSRVSRGESSPGELPLVPMFFDLLYIDGRVLIDEPYDARRSRLEELVGADRCVPRTAVSTAHEAQQALEAALAAGHEGIVLKSLVSPYAAGRRGSLWQKVKPAVTLDLVILAAEWGSGRRQGYLSNIHLGARDPDAPGTFLMLGKTFKGLTDVMLQEMTADLLSLETRREQGVVYVRPERVVEIAFDRLQRSSRYDSGLALRFARVKRFRPDKDARQATSMAEIRAFRPGGS